MQGQYDLISTTVATHSDSKCSPRDDTTCPFETPPKWTSKPQMMPFDANHKPSYVVPHVHVESGSSYEPIQPDAHHYVFITRKRDLQVGPVINP